MPTKRPKSKSPIKTFILPRPAKTLREQRVQEAVTVLLWLIVAVALFTNSLIESILAKWWPGQVAFFRTAVPYVALLIAGCVWLARRKRIERLDLGIDGEMEVGQHLEELREDGYRVFHSIQCDGFDIDHVLIGPTGVYAIETKTPSKRAPNEQVTFDGEKILVGGRPPLRDPLNQARANAKHLSLFLTEQTGERVKARAVVVYPGWYVVNSAKNPEVLVLNPKMLRMALQNHRIEYPQERIIREAGGIVRHQQAWEKTNAV